MMEPKIGRYPIEIFGNVYTNQSEEAKCNCKNQFCPYLGKECTKPRKSEPQIKVGICSLGYKCGSDNSFNPVIICPARFLEEEVFQSIHDKFFPDWDNYIWVKEVNMGISGNVDYVALKKDKSSGEIIDFFCVEIQANGTTGSPYGYVKDFLSKGKYDKDYTFGLNWANEFMKTMMQQVYKKGNVIQNWNKKIVFVIQDVTLDYLNSAVDTSDLKESLDDPVHFMMYKMVWNDISGKYDLKFSSWKSANLECINKILAGANSSEYISEKGFLINAINKAKSDGVL